MVNLFNMNSSNNEKERLEERVKKLQEELQEAQSALRTATTAANSVLAADTTTTTTTLTASSSLDNILAVSHKGYLFKWLDRTIGWGGTKWSLRFVVLQKGKVSYYAKHTDEEPRYVLALRGCAVRDDGFKRNKRHKSSSSSTSSGGGKGQRQQPPPLNETGAYFHVFSIYQRAYEEEVNPTSNTTTKQESASEIIPLLRFSTPSLAEKNQWMALIGQSCAYCDTDDFLREEQTAMAEEERRRKQHHNMALAMPTAQRGTLPPLYFVPPEASSAAGNGLHRRRPSGNLAHYKTKAASRDADKVDARSKKGYPPSKPMHRESAPSYLSEEAPVQNYRGLFNLAIIVLVVSNTRLLLDTIRTYGFVMKFLPSVSDFIHTDDKWHEYPLLSGFVAMQGFIICSYILEKLLSQHKVPNWLGMLLHHVNAHACLFTSCHIVWNRIDNPFIGATLLFHGVITWMKLISYFLANEDYRLTNVETHQATLSALVQDLDPHASELAYPDNINLQNLYYFWLAPTLTYQIAFPKARKVRLWRVASLVFRFFVAFSLLIFLMAQIITPNLTQLTKDLEATDGKLTLELIGEYGLRLSIANTYCWLLVFYGYFHVYLNLFAELLRFGDRVFYKDWWNSSDVSSYWRLWNAPVHYWLVRHVYFPCVRKGLSKTVATFCVFFVSAVMHEVCISIPFHMIRPWAYLGMMGQVPLVWITKFLTRKLPGTSMGNVIFWLSFCVVGQPMAILMYTIDYQFRKEHGGGVNAEHGGGMRGSDEL